MVEDWTKDIGYLQKKLLRWGLDNYAEYPWRQTKNMWHAVAAEVMLQRTNADQVLSVYLEFVDRYPNPIDYLKDEDVRVFATLGLHWREGEFRKLAQVLAETPVLRDAEDFTFLPGVGPYISAAIRSLHLGFRDVIIDSNVVRLYGRFFGFETDGETRRKEKFIELSDFLTPIRKFKSYNYALLDFTREICTPRPKCEKCVLRRKCCYDQQTLRKDGMSASR